MKPSLIKAKQIHEQLFALGDNTPLSTVETIYNAVFEQVDSWRMARERDLVNECKQELQAKDKRITFLESEVTRVFEPTRSVWQIEDRENRNAMESAIYEMARALDRIEECACAKCAHELASAELTKKHSDIINKIKAAHS